MENVITALTSSDANLFFGRSHYFLSSPVLESVLRYIAIKHNPTGIENVELIKCEQYECTNWSLSRCFTEAKTKTITIYNPRRGYEFPSHTEIEGWVSVDAPPYPVAPFLSKASETRVYINAQELKTVLFVRSTTEKWIDLLCSTLCRILPWIYKSDQDISKEEIDLFRLFVGKNSDSNKFKKFIEDFTKGYDFKSGLMKRTLLNWSKNIVESQKRNLMTKSDSIRNNILSYEQDLARCYDQLGEVLMNLNALMMSSQSTDDAFYEFFKNHKQLGIYKVEQNYNGSQSLYFTITDTIEFYDVDEFKRAFENRNSYFRNTGEMKDLFWGIFGANKGVIRVESIFKLNGLSSIEVIRGVRSGNFDETHFPHPHQYFFGCLGANGQYMEKYISEGNWDMAIEQAIASVKNVNFGDYAVMEKFIRGLDNCKNTCRCIIADNGAEMTPSEFLKYIKQSENKEDTNNG